MQADKGGNQTLVLPTTDTYDPQKQPAWQDIVKLKIVTLISWP